jgi:hypothetical protein
MTKERREDKEDEEKSKIAYCLLTSDNPLLIQRLRSAMMQQTLT